MFTKLTLENFKNFRQAELTLGPFTVLVGTNATGKSNLREAFRFLHGISRGYTLSEIIGEKWIEGGVRVWNGIRGGHRELVFFPILYQPPYEREFTFEVDFEIEDVMPLKSKYSIKVDPLGDPTGIALVSAESLQVDQELLLQTYFELSELSWITKVGNHESRNYSLVNRPLFSQLAQGSLDHWFMFDDPKSPDLTRFRGIENMARTALSAFNSMRFFDFSPDAMRQPSQMGQLVLGDRGENLSSVLYAIWQDPERKQTLLSWLEEIMPGEVVDLEFPTDQIGRVLVMMVEGTGQKISAYSLSDGTLRFLAMLAAFFGPERAKFYFFEELETGIHPTRLYLLTQLIENQTAQGDIQVVASTHSPLLLNYLSAKTLESASLLYRLEGEPDAHIRRILDIPDAERLIREQGIMQLFESGWLEDAMFLLDDDEPQEPVAEAVA